MGEALPVFSKSRCHGGGGVNGVAIAQQARESMLVSLGALNNKNVARLSGATADSDTWNICYLDDF